MAPAWDGHSADEVAARCGVPRLVLPESVPSTMDAAHALAEGGTPAGTVVLTDRQTAGRGRGGRSWQSAPGDSLTFTIVERPADEAALAVLSLRLGLAVAPVLERWSEGPVRLKWPNDVYVGDGKLGGILVEARWRHQKPEWVAIGIGINVAPPPIERTTGLAPGASRLEILASLVPAVRAAAARSGGLTPGELEAFAHRDLALGRALAEPVRGWARGVSADGALLVETDEGIVACATGSLVFAET
jgi:BirA family biotin operon repressor/biotin-[acetyl-CoA-carboxylase] ligase